MSGIKSGQWPVVSGQLKKNAELRMRGRRGKCKKKEWSVAGGQWSGEKRYGTKNEEG
jgi:hypothetical protein